MRSVLSSAAAALEKCKTNEIEEFGTENTFDLGLGILCLVRDTVMKGFSKWRSLIHIYLIPLVSLNSSPHRRDHEKSFKFNSFSTPVGIFVFKLEIKFETCWA